MYKELKVFFISVHSFSYWIFPVYLQYTYIVYIRSPLDLSKTYFRYNAQIASCSFPLTLSDTVIANPGEKLKG